MELAVMVGGVGVKRLQYAIVVDGDVDEMERVLANIVAEARVMAASEAVDEGILLCEVVDAYVDGDDVIVELDCDGVEEKVVVGSRLSTGWLLDEPRTVAYAILNRSRARMPKSDGGVGGGNGEETLSIQGGGIWRV